MVAIRAVALDVDGVLTDGGFFWGPSGEEFKRFSFADVMGISLARKAGLIVALISGEDSPLVDRYAKKLGIGDVIKNCKPADARPAVRARAGFVATASGGNGAVRELLDAILAAQSTR